MIAIAEAARIHATDTLADLAEALDSGDNPAAVRERALEVARSAWRIAARAQGVADEQESGRAQAVTTVKHGRWNISTDGSHTWSVCPQCESLIHFPDPGLIADRIREHRYLRCAGDATTTAIGYAMEGREDHTPTRER